MSVQPKVAAKISELHKQTALRKLAQDALDIQNAVNLGAVVHCFSAAMSKLTEIGITGTRERNEHPISVLYASKIASLTNCEFGLTLMGAYNDCSALANANTVEKDIHPLQDSVCDCNACVEAVIAKS